MTHWIVERMVYPVADRVSIHHRSQMWSAGIRVSCDGGRSWVVRGTVRLGSQDSFESRSREVDAIEYVARCKRGYCVDLVVPDPPRAGRVVWPRQHNPR